MLLAYYLLIILCYLLILCFEGEIGCVCSVSDTNLKGKGEVMLWEMIGRLSGVGHY